MSGRLSVRHNNLCIGIERRELKHLCPGPTARAFMEGLCHCVQSIIINCFWWWRRVWWCRNDNDTRCRVFAYRPIATHNTIHNVGHNLRLAPNFVASDGGAIVSAYPKMISIITVLYLMRTEWNIQWPLLYNYPIIEWHFSLPIFFFRSKIINIRNNDSTDYDDSKYKYI